jgi:hypothetical protein
MPSNVIGHERRDEIIERRNECAMPAGTDRASSNSDRNSLSTNRSEAGCRGRIRVCPSGWRRPRRRAGEECLNVRVVVLLRGFAASAGHLAVARAELERERRPMKEHAWKLTPAARADTYQIPPTQFRSTTSRNNDLSRSVAVNDGADPGFRGACDTVLTQFLDSVTPTMTDAHRRVPIAQEMRAPWAQSPRGTGRPRRVQHRDR